MNNTVKRAILLGGIPEEKLSKRQIEVETVSLTSITDQLVCGGDTEEMEALIEYASAVINADTHGIPKWTDPVDFLVMSAKYN